jgi:hypothetical protein
MVNLLGNMHRDFKIKLFIGLSILVYLLYLVTAVCVERVMFADGSHFFVMLLNDQSFWPVANHDIQNRFFSNLFNQLPTVVGLKLGIENLRYLKLLFGAGHFLIPLALYVYCYYLSVRAKDNRFFLIAMFCLVACVIPSDIFIQNPAITALALYWISFHYLFLDINLTKLDYSVILIVLGLSLLSHEGIVLWGLLTSVVSFLLVHRNFDLKICKKNIHILIIGFGGVVHFIFGMYWEFSRPIKEQTIAFVELLRYASPFELVKGETMITFVMFIILIGLLILYFLKKMDTNNIKLFRKTAYYFFVVLLVVTFLHVVRGILHESTNPGIEYSYRFLIPFGSFFLMCLAFVIAYFDFRFDRETRNLLIINICCGLILGSFWQISNNIQWNSFRSIVARDLITPKSALIDPNDIRISLREIGKESVYKYRWPWAWSMLGLTQLPDKKVTALIVPESELDHFVPGRFYAEFKSRYYEKNPLSEKDLANLDIELPYIHFNLQGYFNFENFNQNLGGRYD